jgi:hypothetical protein
MVAAFDAKRVVEASLAKTWGVDVYTYLVREIQCGTDVSQNARFQRKFNGFYRVRRNEAWRTEFYALFERMRRSGNPAFPEIVTALYHATGQVETSFSSKMLNTLKPDMPIWDSHVRAFFGLKDPVGDLTRAISYYAQLVEAFNAFSASDAGQQCVEEFDRLMPSFSGISRAKKVDFFIWAAAAQP